MINYLPSYHKFVISCNELFFRFDREGYDLEYDVEEKGFAQFLCKISLPVDAPSGVNTVAEALVKGNKLLY